MSNVAAIYKIWEGKATALAADIQEEDVTVRQWRNRNSIPRRVWPKIIDAAAKRGKRLTVADFDPQLAKLLEAEQAAAA